MLLNAPSQTDKDIILWPTGSAYIGTNTTPQDVDFLMLWHTPLPFIAQVNYLINRGWEPCSTQYQGVGGWEALRKGQLNLILCASATELLSWIGATELSRLCGLLDKSQRVTMFEAVRDSLSGAACSVIKDLAFTSTAHGRMCSHPDYAEVNAHVIFG